MVIYILYIGKLLTSKICLIINGYLLLWIRIFKLSLLLAILHYSTKIYVFISLRRNDKKTKKHMENI